MLALAACESPRWRAAVAPEPALLFVDGVAADGAEVEGPIPYYGTVDLAGVPAPGTQPSRRTVRALLDIDEPVTPWIFPFDVVVESAIALFSADPVPSASLVLPLRTDVAEKNEIPADASAFLERARRMATER